MKDKSNESKKRSYNKYNFEEDISPSSNSSNNKYSRESKKNKSIHIKETHPFDLEKNNQKMTEYDNYKINIEDKQIKKSISSRFKRKINNIYYEREKEKREKKEKEKIELNYRTEVGDNDKIQIPKESRKRPRFFSGFSTSVNKIEQTEKENNRENLNQNEQKRKIEKTPLNIFNKFRKERKKELNELKEENQVQQENKEQNRRITVNKKVENLEININNDKDKENGTKNKFPKISKRVVPYRSFKRNTTNNLQNDLESLNILKKYKKDEDKDKDKNKEENIEPKRMERKRFLSYYEKSKKINDNSNNKINILYDKYILFIFKISYYFFSII